METTTFDNEKAEAVEKAVCEIFGCTIYDIVCFGNTLFKKVVVFLLTKLYSFNKRNIGLKYQITYLYVPTVVDEVEYMIKVVPGFNDKIENIYEKMDRI
ncbi:hypothetical protein [Flavobacterium johnsoniae]|nr:hypothetical protein [Flavobacterium johnsoniae]